MADQFTDAQRRALVDLHYCAWADTIGMSNVSRLLALPVADRTGAELLDVNYRVATMGETRLAVFENPVFKAMAAFLPNCGAPVTAFELESFLSLARGEFFEPTIGVAGLLSDGTGIVDEDKLTFDEGEHYVTFVR
jgi:hypothetical protein